MHFQDEVQVICHFRDDLHLSTDHLEYNLLSFRFLASCVWNSELLRAFWEWGRELQVWREIRWEALLWGQVIATAGPSSGPVQLEESGCSLSH